MSKSGFELSPGHIFIVIIAISVFLFTQSAAAQQEITVGNDFGVGARAMGMGGAFMGVADDATALYWNPAGLSQIKQMEFFGALSHDKLETETEYFGEFDSTFASNTRPNSFGIVFPVPVYRGGLAFALGINRLQSFDARVKVSGFNNLSVEEDEQFGQLSISELSDESGSIYSWSFGMAVDIAPGVSLGAALNFLSGDYTYSLELDADDTRQLDSVLTGFSYSDIDSYDYFGVDGKIGLLARLIDKVRLGITIEIPMDFSVDRYWDWETYAAYDTEPDEDWVENGAFYYEISRPFRFGAGIATYPLPGAIIAADVLYTDWTQTKYSDPPAEDISNEDFIDDYRDTFQLRVGGEYTIPAMGLSIRAGYLLDPLPYTPDSIEIDSDRHYITAGIGMMLDRVLSLDVAYIRGSWKESINDGIAVKDRNSNRIFISARYRF